jgi:hypothetical protein
VVAAAAVVALTSFAFELVVEAVGFESTVVVSAFEQAAFDQVAFEQAAFDQAEGFAVVE